MSRRRGGKTSENWPAFQGWVDGHPQFQVPSGTTDGFFRPCRDSGTLPDRKPSAEALGYFQTPRPAKNQRVRGTAALPGAAPVARAAAKRFWTGLGGLNSFAAMNQRGGN